MRQDKNEELNLKAYDEALLAFNKVAGVHPGQAVALKDACLVYAKHLTPAEVEPLGFDKRNYIVHALKREALDDPEIGWLSGISDKVLIWREFDEDIVINGGGGSIDIGHLAEVVEDIIVKLGGRNV